MNRKNILKMVKWTGEVLISKRDGRKNEPYNKITGIIAQLGYP